MAKKDKEKLMNDKYYQRCQMIDSDFMNMVKADAEVNHVPLNYWRKRF